MKNKKLFLIIAGVLAAVAATVCLILGRTVNHAVKIAEVLKPMLNAENQSMRLDAETAVGGESITLGCKVYLVRQDDIPYRVMEQNGHSIYLTDNLLLLENGKAFKIGDGMQSQFSGYGDLLPLIASLYEIMEITAVESDAETSYHIRVSGAQVQQLLSIIFPTEEVMLEEVEELQVSLITKDDFLDRIQLSADAKDVQLQIAISDFQNLSAGEYSIPAVIAETVASIDTDSLFSLTEDLYRLVLALEPFSDMDGINGSVKLTADCGIIQLDTAMDLADLKTTSNTRIDPDSLQALPELLGWLCMEGDISCTEDSGSYVYSLILDRDSMEKLSKMILPEIVSYAGDLTEGSVSVILEGDRITSMEVSIKGEINGLITMVPIALGADFSFE